MKKHIIIPFIACCSCLQKDRIVVENQGDTRIEKTIKNDTLVLNKKYTKGLLSKTIAYQKAIPIKINDYFNGKLVGSMALTAAPNHYTQTTYAKNGDTLSVGEIDLYPSENKILRRGVTIFHATNKKVRALLWFKHDGQQQYITRKLVLDTLSEQK
jgi:hypothetical protein